MKSANALIINQDPDKSRIVQFYVYNSVAPIKAGTQFNFASKSGTTTSVGCSGYGGMKVYVNNKNPGWGLQRNAVYLYDGSSFDLIMSKEALLEKTKHMSKIGGVAQVQAAQTQQVPAAQTQQVAVQPEKAPKVKRKKKKVAGSPAMAEYDNFYDQGYADRFQSAGDMYMEPYVQPVVADYGEVAAYGQYGQYGQYGSAGSQMMSGELVFLGLFGLFLTMICAVLVCVAGAAIGWFSSLIFTSRTMQRTKVDRWAEQSAQEEV